MRGEDPVRTAMFSSIETAQTNWRKHRSIGFSPSPPASLLASVGTCKWSMTSRGRGAAGELGVWRCIARLACETEYVTTCDHFLSEDSCNGGQLQIYSSVFLCARPR